METKLKIDLLKNRITANDAQIKNLLKKISNCSTNYEDLSQLNQKLTSCMNEIRRDLNDYRILIEIIRKNSSENDNLYENLLYDLESKQQQFEFNSNLIRKSMNLAQKQLNTETRRKLFSQTENLRKRLTTDSMINNEKIVEKSNELTNDLYSASRLLSKEVEKSGKNLDTLILSSELATETTQEFYKMSNLIANSKTLLSKYGRREMTDKILTILALGFFFGSVVYVLVKRIYIRQ